MTGINRDGKNIAPTHRVRIEHMYPDRHGLHKPTTSITECYSRQGAESEATKARAWRPAPISVTVEEIACSADPEAADGLPTEHGGNRK